MKIECTTIQFRIDCFFPDCENDMVYRESRQLTPILPSLYAGAKIPIDESKLDQTPTSDSVNFCLNYLAGFVNRDEMEIIRWKWIDYSLPPIVKKTANGEEYNSWDDVPQTELEKIGVSVKSWYGLMMSNCHLICEVEGEKFSTELVEKAKKIVRETFEKYLVYYESPERVEV